MIRQETIGIWYSTNAFFINLRDCDDTLLSAFTKHIQDMQIDINMKGEVRGGKDWSNLLIWCRRLYDGESMYLVKKETLVRRASILSASHEIVLRHRALDLCLDECDRALDNLKTIVQQLDTEWD